MSSIQTKTPSNKDKVKESNTSNTTGLSYREFDIEEARTKVLPCACDCISNKCTAVFDQTQSTQCEHCGNYMAPKCQDGNTDSCCTSCANQYSQMHKNYSAKKEKGIVQAYNTTKESLKI